MWFLGIIRQIFAFIDTVAFSLIDNAYDLIMEFSTASFFNGEVITQVRNNLYVIIGIFALFRIALLLVNAMINPDKLNEKGNGIGNVLVNLVIMFALLIGTPILFDEALDLQEKIVKGNYVQKIFLDTGSLEKLDDPGKMMQSIAISSLITLNDEVDDCDSECQDAVDAYEDMKKTGFTMPKVSLYVDNKAKANGEKVFVYDYMILATFAVGVFITYVLLSFAIDIAVRMVELTALQILAPMFIVTYIDPKSAKSGPFSKWLQTVGKTYVSLFIKLAIVAIMLLLMSLVHDMDLSGNMSKLLLLIAILIFAKKAPKWIGNMIGVEGGIGELGIGKKIKDGALGGALLAKGARGAVGIAAGIGAATHNQLKHRRAQRKEIRDKEGLKLNKAARQSTYNKRGLDDNATYAEKVRALRNARSEAYAKEKAGWDKEGIKEAGKQLFGSVAAGAMLGGKAGINAENIKGTFKAANQAAEGFAGRVGLNNHSGFFDNLGKKIKGLPDSMEGMYGSGSELYERRETIAKKEKAAKFTKGGDFGVQDSGLGKDKVVTGQGDANKILNTLVEKGFQPTAENYNAVQYGINRGLIDVNKEGKIDLSNFKLETDGNGKTLSFDYGEGKITVEKLEKGCGGVFDMDSSATASQEKFVNTYQNTALNNYQQNEQARAQAVSAYESLKPTADATSAQAKALANEMKDVFSSLSIALDTSSMSGMQECVKKGIAASKALKDAEKDEEKAKILKKQLEKLEDLSDKISSARSFEDTINSSLETIREVNDAQNKLKSVIKTIDGDTLSEKANNLAIAGKKLDEKIDAMAEKKDDKK